MKRSMAFIFFSVILLALTSTANAEELWGCNAFTASRDGSKASPFVLRGDGDTYFWRGEYSDKRIKKVAENRVLDFDIFVDVTRNTSRSAYYIKKTGDKLKIKEFFFDMPHFFTDCFRQ